LITESGGVIGATPRVRRNGILAGSATTVNAPAIAAIPYDGSFRDRLVIVK
jgi:hypothetical protein